MRHHRFTTIIVLILFFLMSPTLGIWPKPQEISTGETTLLIDSSFHIKVTVVVDKPPPQDLLKAAKRVEDTLKGNLAPGEKKHYYLSPERGLEFLPREGASKQILSHLTIHVYDPSSIFDQAIKPLDEREETYILEVPVEGEEGAVLFAKTALGAFRGLMSFEMLFYAVPVSLFQSICLSQDILLRNDIRRRLPSNPDTLPNPQPRAQSRLPFPTPHHHPLSPSPHLLPFLSNTITPALNGEGSCSIRREIGWGRR